MLKWKLQYGSALERYQMLVLHGPSRTGKSRLARSLFGEMETLVADVQHAVHPDLHGFDRKKHKAILLDEVSSPQFIVQNKKLLQAHVGGAIFGQSATQLYTYEVFLWRIPIMLTTNVWDYASYAEPDKNWIESNCVAVHIAQPVWHSGDTPPSSPRAAAALPLREGTDMSDVSPARSEF